MEEFLNDVDLLSMLEDSVEDDKKESPKKKETKSESVVEQVMSDKGNIANSVPENDIKDIVDKFSTSVSNNPGTGNTDTDLANWFDGVDTLPSDGLNSTMANSSVKLEYGLTHSTLTGFKLMNKLRKFIEDDAFDLLFSENAILGIDSEEVLDRVKVAFTMYKELASLSQRAIQNQRDYSIKSGSESSDVDRLSMLLSTIPNDKLEKILKEIAFSDDKQ